MAAAGKAWSLQREPFGLSRQGRAGQRCFKKKLLLLLLPSLLMWHKSKHTTWRGA